MEFPINLAIFGKRIFPVFYFPQEMQYLLCDICKTFAGKFCKNNHPIGPVCTHFQVSEDYFCDKCSTHEDRDFANYNDLKSSVKSICNQIVVQCKFYGNGCRTKCWLTNISLHEKFCLYNFNKVKRTLLIAKFMKKLVPNVSLIKIRIETQKGFHHKIKFFKQKYLKKILEVKIVFYDRIPFTFICLYKLRELLASVTWMKFPGKSIRDQDIHLLDLFFNLYPPISLGYSNFWNQKKEYSLNRISFCYCNFSSLLLRYLLHSPIFQNKLIGISFKGCQFIDNIAISNQIEFKESSRQEFKLESFSYSFKSNPTLQYDLNSIFNYIISYCKNKYLKTLKLKDDSVSIIEKRFIFHFNKLKNIINLHLYSLTINDIHDTFALSISKLPRLKFIKISYCSFSKSYLSEKTNFFAILGTSFSLRIIRFFENNLRQIPMAIEVMKANKSIEEIYLIPVDLQLESHPISSNVVENSHSNSLFNCANAQIQDSVFYSEAIRIPNISRRNNRNMAPNNHNTIKIFSNWNLFTKQLHLCHCLKILHLNFDIYEGNITHHFTLLLEGLICGNSIQKLVINNFPLNYDISKIIALIIKNSKYLQALKLSCFSETSTVSTETINEAIKDKNLNPANVIFKHITYKDYAFNRWTRDK